MIGDGAPGRGAVRHGRPCYLHDLSGRLASPWSETNDADGLAHKPSSVGWAAGAVRAGDDLGHGAVVFRCLSATGPHSEQSDHLRQVGEYAGGALSGAQRQFPGRMDTYRSPNDPGQIRDPGAASLQLR